MITQAILLNMIPIGINPTINVSQYNYGEQWAFTLILNNGLFNVPAGADVYVQGTKKDGSTFKEACTYSGSIVTATVTQDMTDVCGVATAEIRIEKDDSVLSSQNFFIQVEKAA